MLFQPIGADFPDWLGYYLLAVLGGPTLLLIIYGIVCGRFMDWISPLFGLALGIGVAAVGWTLYFIFLVVDRGHVFPNLEMTAGESFGSLAVLIAIQVSLVVVLCRFVNWRRDQSWGIRRW